MAKFFDLPTELQRLIVQNLSEGELYRVRFLNSLLDTQWRDVGVSPECDWAVRHLHTSLHRAVDPFVARRLRGLYISLGKFEPEEPRTVDSFLSVFFNSLPLLPNITSLNIKLFKRATFDVANFFQVIISLPIARKLQDLTLTGPLEMFDWLWKYSAHNTPFPNVTKLDLDLIFSPPRTHLRIQTKLDLSSLFNALLQPLSGFDSLFPNLKSFALRLHFNHCFQSSPQILHRFLHTHTNLHLLHLDLITTLINVDPGDAGPQDAWLAELVNNDYQLPCLQTLNLYPSDNPDGFSPLLTLIKRTAPTLISLKVFQRYLTDEEAQQLLDAVTEGKAQVQATSKTATPRPKLKSLMMAVIYLTVPFLDLLTTNFPELEQLTLWADEIIGSDQDSFYELLNRRRYNPNVKDTQDVLHTWKLNELDFESFELRKNAEQALRRTIPALARRVEFEESSRRLSRS